MPKWSAQYQDRLWDVAIIGAGMGGGMVARALTDAGHDVLLIDRGNEEITPHHLDFQQDLKTATNERRLSQGTWPEISTFEVDGVVRRHFVPYGAGVGGCTNLYAAALERFERHDVDPLPEISHPLGGWAFRYDELLPYYELAERMLHIVGTQDPLNADLVDHLHTPPPLGPLNAELMQSFAQSGLHPYRLHVGIRYRPGCDECLGRICRNNCRADVQSVLSEGLKKPVILERTEIIRLDASADRVSRAVFLQGSHQVEIHARIFVLAAGAIHTPRLLLRSCGEHWPNGLANRSGMVGRNLMFHAMERIAIWPSKKAANTGPRKSLGFRDFYLADGQRLGSVQSTGFEAGYGDVLVHLYNTFDDSMASRLPSVRPLLRIPAAVAYRLFGPGMIFTGLVEDLPYPDNRILLDETEADGIRIVYTIRDELRERVARFRKLLKQSLDKRCRLFLSRDVELNFGHPCGTCVMGDDPTVSVVDRDCRAHGIGNLFVVDGSFMPTSGSTNPGLTIAANALRVSKTINRVLSSTDEAEFAGGMVSVS